MRALFITSVKLGKKRVAIILWAIIILIGVVAGLLSMRGRDPGPADRAPQTPAEFLASLGFEIDETSEQIIDVVIPREFGVVYENYNNLQRQAGFDLTAFKGKQVQRYCYNILNFSDFNGEVVGNVLVDGDKIIGGDVCSVRYDGFIRPLTPYGDAAVSGDEAAGETDAAADAGAADANAPPAESVPVL